MLAWADIRRVTRPPEVIDVGAKVSRVRAVNADPFGNLVITESNYGYVRRIKFQRLVP